MIHNSKFVFFGTPEFAAIILDKLIKAGFIPQAVVCNPDRPVGRKQIITPPPVKLVIGNQTLENRVKVFQPENLSSLMSDVSCLNPDFFIVAAYAKILPKEILDIPRLGSIGVHPSLLPKYRGPAPIQSAILAGEKETGVTLFLMDEKVDHGPIITNCRLQIADSDNYEILSKNLADSGGDLLVETLPKFLKGETTPQVQNESLATYTKKFSAKGALLSDGQGSGVGGKTEDAYIEPADLEKAQTEGGETAVQIERKIRALNPEPGTWTLRQTQGKQQRVKILEAELTLEGKLKLKKIQVEGKKPTESRN